MTKPILPGPMARHWAVFGHAVFGGCVPKPNPKTKRCRTCKRAARPAPGDDEAMIYLSGMAHRLAGAAHGALEASEMSVEPWA